MQQETILNDTSMNHERRAKLAVIGSVCAIFFPGSLIFGFPGLMSPIWREMLDIQSGALSYLMFFMLASLGIFMFFVGKWTATLGVQRLMVIGTVITSLATVMVAFVNGVWMIYLWAFLVGSASCFIYSTGINSVQRWFPHKRGLVSGIVNLTFGISAALMVPIYRLLIELLGYRLLCLALGAIVLIIGLFASRFTELPQLMIEKSAGKASDSLAHAAVSIDFTPREAVRTTNFWLIWGVWALMGAAGVTMVTVSVNYGLFRGYDLSAAVAILTAFNVTNGLSRIISGAVSDIIGRKITLSITFVITGIAYILLPFVSSLASLSLLAAMIGFGYGTLFSTSAPMISDCFGLKNFGVILGLVFTAYGFVASIIGPVVTGLLLTATSDNYQLVFHYLAILAFISSILIMAVKPPVLKQDHNV
jgi:MFS transporter, OFA family, oxalate/formate antiporter